MEGQGLEHTMAELDAKLVPTIILHRPHWTPAQLINFQVFVTREASSFISLFCLLIEVNILSVFEETRHGSIQMIKKL